MRRKTSDECYRPLAAIRILSGGVFLVIALGYFGLYLFLDLPGAMFVFAMAGILLAGALAASLHREQICVTADELVITGMWRMRRIDWSDIESIDAHAAVVATRYLDIHCGEPGSSVAVKLPMMGPSRTRVLLESLEEKSGVAIRGLRL